MYMCQCNEIRNLNVVAASLNGFHSVKVTTYILNSAVSPIYKARIVIEYFLFYLQVSNILVLLPKQTIGIKALHVYEYLQYT